MDEIIGGIQTSPTTIITGGREYVVGENAKWALRQKYIMLNNAPATMSDKKLIKIVGLAVPLSFSRKVYYDDSKQQPPQRSIYTKEYKKKALDMAKKKLDQPIASIIKSAIVTYNLKQPLDWALGDLLKLLAISIKKHKPNMRKIKVSPGLGTIITQIKKNEKYFKYNVNTNSGITELIGTTLETLKKSRIPQSMWKPPRLSKPIYPELDEGIQAEVDAIRNLDRGAGLRDYLKAILDIENALMEHINEIEQFYVCLAGDIKKIEESLKKFLKRQP